MTQSQRAIALAAALFLTACGSSHDGASAMQKTAAPKPAIAVLHPTDNHRVAGTVRFIPTPHGVKVSATVTGLTPGQHGMHVHMYGDCSAADASSAGPHFNFRGDPDAASTRITGNLGNLTADDNGNAELQTRIAHANLAPPRSIIGRAVVVHAKANNPAHPPAGAAGARVACGVIGMAKGRQHGA